MAYIQNRKDIIRKDVQYLNKDFGEFRRNLIDFTKNYFPKTYNDFNESSPGMLFIELASYVGDVLSFYTDIQLRESLLATVQEKINLYNLSNSLGYKPKYVTPASVDLDIFQLLPANGSGNNTTPDFKYALQINEGMVVSGDEGVEFRTIDPVDFRYSSSYDPTEITVYSLDTDGNIEYFLLKKNVKAVSGNQKTKTYAFTNPKVYDKIVIQDENVLEIVKILDSDGDTWYEVDYLAESLIPKTMPNVPYNDPVLSNYRSSAPYLLCYKQTEKRFVTRLRADSLIEIQFGAGISSEADEDIVPNPLNVGIGLDYFERVVDLSIDPKNFLYTRTYGKAPSNTTLTVTYTVGGGITHNVLANSLNSISSISITTPIDSVDASIFQSIKNSVVINNPQPARGGLSDEPIENTRRIALANFAAQNRVVTKEDYITRAYSMSPKFGAVAKAYVEQDDLVTNENILWNSLNPFAINLYVLGYTFDKKFTDLNDAIKFNLINYLKQYRMLTDSVNIKTPYIINIGVNFEILVDPSFNANSVLLNAINLLKDELNNDNMQINQAIFINNLISKVTEIEGVRAVANLHIHNLYKASAGYSGNYYDIDTATRNGIIYPSLDPSIFEVRFPNRDIFGRVITS